MSFTDKSIYGLQMVQFKKSSGLCVSNNDRQAQMSQKKFYWNKKLSLHQQLKKYFVPEQKSSTQSFYTIFEHEYNNVTKKELFFNDLISIV